jgi:hypothetical protein
MCASQTLPVQLQTGQNGLDPSQKNNGILACHRHHHHLITPCEVLAHLSVHSPRSAPCTLGAQPLLVSGPHCAKPACQSTLRCCMQAHAALPRFPCFLTPADAQLRQVAGDGGQRQAQACATICSAAHLLQSAQRLLQPVRAAANPKRTTLCSCHQHNAHAHTPLQPARLPPPA